MKFATKAIHAGQEPEPSTGAIIAPIFQTSTYVQAGLGEHKGFEYSRTQNPTRSALEECMAAIEDGRYGLAFASVETPTNPLLRLIDIQAVAEIAHRHNLLLVVDNTFASPYFQQPLKLGADIVVHSTTKYLNGHSDIIGGALVLNNEEVYQAIKFYQNAAGGVPSPFDSWLTLRGIKTLAVRMRQHEENAIAVAKFLAEHPRVEKVYYPGLPAHPDYALAKRQMSGFGGMVSFQFKGVYADVDKVVRRFKFFALAESLGGVDSLVCHPASMTHGSIPKDIRESRGLTDALLRLSVGIEDVDDLLADLEQALA